MKLQASDHDITQRSFGQVNGVETILWTCVNAQGVTMQVSDLGATLVRFLMPDQLGRFENLVLGFDSAQDYCQKKQPYFGATVGRVCNRIAHGCFHLNGVDYKLPLNHGPHHIHGGVQGFSARIWQGQPLYLRDAVGVRFSLQSAAGEEGYPGNVAIQMDYILNDTNELSLIFTGTTDAATHVNLTHHGYWNLKGAGNGDVLDHQVQLNSNQIVAVGADGIPTGELQPITNTSFDCRSLRPIHSVALPMPVGGFDHCYDLRAARARQGLSMPQVAFVIDQASGRSMSVRTNQVGVQFYTGNKLDESKSCAGFGPYAGFCLETSGFPDAPNQPHFPSTRLIPGEIYHHATVLAFNY